MHRWMMKFEGKDYGAQTFTSLSSALDTAQNFYGKLDGETNFQFARRMKKEHALEFTLVNITEARRGR